MLSPQRPKATRIPGSRRRSALLVLLGLTAVAVAAGVLAPPAAASHGSFPTSDGIYRIPYAEGLDVTVTNDHHDHPHAKDRIDLAAGKGEEIVAAASGWIRGIVDHHGNTPGSGDGMDKNGDPQDDSLEHQCTDDDDVTGRCSDYNNYVWIEHPNGEWSKYSHPGTGTVTDQGWSVGDWVEAGDVIGLENDVGAATGPHLHHEVARPNNPGDALTWTQDGGFMTNGTNRVPRVCDIQDNLYEAGETYTADPCEHDRPDADIGGPYRVDEGTALTLDGTGSSDPEGNPLTYRWEPDTNLDDPALAQPTFLAGDNGNHALTLTVYDQIEALADDSATTVTVDNAAPEVTIDPDQVTVIEEGGTVTVRADYSDPGFEDSHSAEIDWDTAAGDTSAPTPIVTDAGDPGPVEGTVSDEFTYADDGVYQVTVTVTDDDGASATASFVLTVENAAPEVGIAFGQTSVIDEGETVTVTANYSDPGFEDTHTAEIDWDTPAGDTGAPGTSVTDPGDPGPVQGTLSDAFTYGDNGTYDIGVTVTDDDGASTTETFTLTVDNVAPTAELATDGVTDFLDTPTFITGVGEGLELSAEGTDPGSDDLTFTWEWDDGSVTDSTSLNDPDVGPDPFPSPTVNPRDVTDTQTNSWASADHYVVTLTVTDDDGAERSDAVDVIVVADADMVRGAGYWYNAYAGRGPKDLGGATLEAYLDIVGHMSAVFNEAVDAGDRAAAAEVLDSARTRGSLQAQLERQLLAAWLNFANGAIGLADEVDTTGDGVPDTRVADALSDAEDTRLDPTAERSELERRKDTLEAINTLDDG